MFHMTKLPILLFAIVISGCSQCNIPEQMPEITQLIGTWHPTSSTNELIKKKGYEKNNQKVELYNNGTFKIYNMPNMWRSNYKKQKGKYENVTGIWEVYEKNERGYLLTFDVKNINGKKITFIYAGCEICETSDGYKLMFVPEPDLNHDLVFVK